MKKGIYSITGSLIILLGVLITLYNIYIYIFFEIGTLAPSILTIILLGVILSLGIISLFVLNGLFYLKVGKNQIKENKLIKSASILTLLGIFLFILSFVMLLIMCPPATNFCDGFGMLIILIIGLYPSGALYLISLLLLGINKFKK